MLWFLLALCVIAGIAAMPWLIDRRRPVPTPRLTETTLDLPAGTLRFRWWGPVRGPVAVAVHDIARSLEDWEELAQGLAALGYRTLAFDLPGHGGSAGFQGTGPEPGAELDLLAALLDHFDLREDLTLIGHGLGGAVATAYAATRPDRLRRLVLLAPAGVVPHSNRTRDLICRLPLLGDWLFLGFAPHLRGVIPGGPPADGLLDRRGARAAILAQLRGLMLHPQEGAHRLLSRQGTPVAALWGGQDAEVPLSAPGVLALWNRSAKQEVIRDAGHDLPQTHATEVTALLRDILREDWR